MKIRPVNEKDISETIKLIAGFWSETAVLCQLNDSNNSIEFGFGKYI